MNSYNYKINNLLMKEINILYLSLKTSQTVFNISIKPD